MLLPLRAIGEHGLRTGTHKAPEGLATVDANLRDTAVLQVLVGVAAEFRSVNYLIRGNTPDVSSAEEERCFTILSGVRDDVKGATQFKDILLIDDVDFLCHSTENLEIKH